MEKIYEQTLRLLSLPSSSLLRPGAVIVVEHDKRFDPAMILRRCSATANWSKETQL